MYNLLKNPLANYYQSLTKDEGAWLKLLVDNLQSLLVC